MEEHNKEPYSEEESNERQQLLNEKANRIKGLPFKGIFCRYGDIEILNEDVKNVLHFMIRTLAPKSLLICLLALQFIILWKIDEKLFLIVDFKAWKNLQDTGYVSKRAWTELAYFYKESKNDIIKTILPFYDKKHKEWAMVIIEIHKPSKKASVIILSKDPSEKVTILLYLTKQLKKLFSTEGSYCRREVLEPRGVIGLFSEVLQYVTGNYIGDIDHVEFLTEFLAIILNLQSSCEQFSGTYCKPTNMYLSSGKGDKFDHLEKDRFFKTLFDNFENGGFVTREEWVRAAKNGKKGKRGKNGGVNLSKKRREKIRKKMKEVVELFKELPFEDI